MSRCSLLCFFLLFLPPLCLQAQRGGGADSIQNYTGAARGYR